MNSVDNFSQLPFFDHPPRRVVSLVPSMTESLIDLGAGEYLIGITELCQVPEEMGGGLTQIGNPKTFQVQSVIDLEPDLVIVDREVNRDEDLKSMLDNDLKVWVIGPRTVDDVIKILWELVGLFRVEVQGTPRIKTLEKTLEWTKLAAYDLLPVSVFCPMGEVKSASGLWWKTFNRETYAHDLISHCGGQNVFADHVGRFPLEHEAGFVQVEDADERETRFPWVSPDEVITLSPDVILLPVEYLLSGEVHETLLMDLLSETPAVRNGRLHHIDGSLITWHGSRLARALAELPVFLQPVEGSRG